MASVEHNSAFDRSPNSNPSRPASIFSAQSIDTLVADQGYRGYASEEAYLNALKNWAQSKAFFETDEQLHGFYGTKTVDAYLNQPGWKKKEKKVKDKKDQRRATVAQLPSVPEHNGSTPALSRQNTEQGSTTQEGAAPASTESKGSKLKRVFTRRKTIV